MPTEPRACDALGSDEPFDLAATPKGQGRKSKVVACVYTPQCFCHLITEPCKAVAPPEEGFLWVKLAQGFGGQVEAQWASARGFPTSRGARRPDSVGQARLAAVCAQSLGSWGRAVSGRGGPVQLAQISWQKLVFVGMLGCFGQLEAQWASLRGFLVLRGGRERRPQARLQSSPGLTPWHLGQSVERARGARLFRVN